MAYGDEDFSVVEGSYWDEGRGSYLDDGGSTMDAEYAGAISTECPECGGDLEDDCNCDY